MSWDKTTRAKKIVSGFNMELQELARAAITDIGRTSSEIILICGVYCRPWQKLLQSLHPDSADNLEKIKRRRQTPTVIASANVDDFWLLLSELGHDIPAPLPNTNEDAIWLLVLNGEGYTWLDFPLKIAVTVKI